ncbi:MAG: type II secretion system secretin GspD [Halioglobus sp.]|nr:type II secretion system secretin GspD [Halioglobus sp.]
MSRNFLAACVLLAVAGCGTAPGKPGADAADAAGGSASPAAVDASAALSTSVSDLAAAGDGEERRAQAVIYRGNDRQVRLPAAAQPVRFVGDDVSLNFEQAPLGEVVHAIVGDILGLDYIVDHPIKGQVTLRTRTPIPRDELLGVLESLLKANNSLMIRGADGRYLITGSQGASKLSPSVSGARNSVAGYSTIIVPLQYISAAAMAEILKPLAEDSAFVRVDNARNLLMLAGTRAQLDGWLDIISTFDVDMLKGMSVGLFPLEYSSLEEVSAGLEQLLGGDDGGKAGLGGLIRVIPFERLNSVLVVTPRAHYLDTVATWIKRLDAPADASYEKQLYVYPVQNTTASRLADLLTGIYAGGATAGGQTAARAGGAAQGDLFPTFEQPGVAPGMSPETVGTSSGSATAVSGGSRSGRNTAAVTSGTLGSGANPSAIEDVRVVADEENNALMIYATGKQYRIIERALEKLDVVATQVIIEASILEVSLTDELRYGLEWTFKNGIGSDYDGVGTLAAAAGGPAAVVPGFSYTVTNSMGDISAVLNALSKDSLLNVISTPSVMVLDNHTAFIHVGDQVPVFDQQTESDGGRITQSVTYRDTGVKLTVTPSVNAGGLVTMDVEQSVTDVGEIDSATGQRQFLERNIMSRVAVRSNQSVVLGGLIRENASNSESGVPILHKLPLIGPLFGTVNKQDRRTELLVIITPRALYKESELREVSEEMRSRIRHMELIDPPPG